MALPRPPRLVSSRGALVCAVLAFAACGYTEIRDQCPTCTVVSRFVASPVLPPGTRTVYLIVPGLLGFGWEWDEPLVRLRGVPDAFVEVFDWRPSSSGARVASDLARLVNRLLRDEPAVERVVILGHSAGGLVTARAAAALTVPVRCRVWVVNMGTPYAGMFTFPFEGPHDAWNAPLAVAIGGTLRSYPPPAARVTIESWITPWPGDPVMKPRFGHRPDDPAVGPPGPRHFAPPGADHNRFVAHVIDDVVARATAASPAASKGQAASRDR